jgi:hypothetical protein
MSSDTYGHVVGERNRTNYDRVVEDRGEGAKELGATTAGAATTNPFKKTRGDDL